MSVERERDFLTQARLAFEQHRADEAQGILIHLVVREPRNEEAWVLLAQTFDALDRRLECLQQARQHNPYSQIIAASIQELKAQVANAAFGAEAAAPPAVTSAAEPAPPMSNPALAEILLAAANVLAQAILMATEPLETRALGFEFVHQLERAQMQDAVLTHRWANTAGRAALLKYEKGLTQLLINLPHTDPHLAILREQRQHALGFFK